MLSVHFLLFCYWLERISVMWLYCLWGFSSLLMHFTFCPHAYLAKLVNSGSLHEDCKMQVRAGQCLVCVCLLAAASRALTTSFYVCLAGELETGLGQPSIINKWFTFQQKHANQFLTTSPCGTQLENELQRRELFVLELTGSHKVKDQKSNILFTAIARYCAALRKYTKC